MKKLLLSMICALSFTQAFAEDQSDKYMKEVLKQVPDMQEGGTVSKKRSETEGAALQNINIDPELVTTGLTVNSFAMLLNNDNKVIKKIFKEKKFKGYLIVKQAVVVMEGYRSNIDDYSIRLDYDRNPPQCKFGYCVLTVIKDVTLLDEKGNKQEFSKFDLEEAIRKFGFEPEQENQALVVNSDLITKYRNSYSATIVLGYGVGGTDISPYFK